MTLHRVIPISRAVHEDSNNEPRFRCVACGQQSRFFDELEDGDCTQPELGGAE